MGSRGGCNRVTMLLTDDGHTGRLWVAGIGCNRVTMLLTDDGHTGRLWIAGIVVTGLQCYSLTMGTQVGCG